MKPRQSVRHVPLSKIDDHPGNAAAAYCTHKTGTAKVGGVACGPCWEQVIRDDERGAS